LTSTEDGAANFKLRLIYIQETTTVTIEIEAVTDFCGWDAQ